MVGQSEIGSIVGEKYELVETIGSGGMGTVFKAKHVTLPKYFALKILRRELSNDADFRARFDQEAKTASLLNHPHLVSIYDHGNTAYGEAYLVMDFIDGQSLGDSLKSLKRIEQRQSVKIFAQICEGLTQAHGLGVIHRDLKPSNVMLVRSKDGFDFVKVVDFGIAKMVGADGNAAHITQSLTKTGEFFGSPLYMSPEQATGGKPDHRTDIYSMGVLMYECLTSAPPFRGENFFVTTRMHNEAQAKPFEKDLYIDESLEQIVFKALEKNPADRFQSMEELRVALLGVFADDLAQSRKKKNYPTQIQTGERGDRDQSSKQTRALALIAICVLTLLTGGVAFSYLALDKLRSTGSAPQTKSAADTLVPILVAPVTPAATSPAKPDLPPLPTSVQLPESAKTLSARQLVTAGNKLLETTKGDWQNLMPARYFTSAIESDPRLDFAYESLASFYWQQHERAPASQARSILERSTQVFREQTKYSPNNLDAFTNLTTAYSTLDKWPEALAAANQGLKIAPQNTELHLKRAYVYHGAHRWLDCIGEYEKYINPSTEPVCAQVLASTYQEVGNHKKALEISSKWLEHSGPNVGLLMMKADAEKDLGMNKESLRDYQTLVKKWPEQLAQRGAEIKNLKAKLAAKGKI